MTTKALGPGDTAGTAVPRLRRVRWAVRATLTLGVAASVAANILHATPNPISQVIAAWPPLALLLTVELISRIPVHHRSLAAVRLAATSTIASIAAWVSYWHMVGVAARYGETGPTPYLLPLSVDGLVIVASVSLVEIAGHIRAATGHDTAPAQARPVPDVPVTRIGSHGEPTAPVGDPRSTRAHHPTSKEAGGCDSRNRPRDDYRPGGRQTARGGDLYTTSPSSAGSDGRARRPESQETDSLTVDHGPVPADTAAAVAYWYARDPGLHPAEIGAKIGRSERTVRRYLPGTSRRATVPARGLVGTAQAR